MTGNGCAGHGNHQNRVSAVIAARGAEWTVKQQLENRVNSHTRPESAAGAGSYRQRLLNGVTAGFVKIDRID
jgi:hypothetical protein